jgi:two-component system sensor histidine kinase ChiS
LPSAVGPAGTRVRILAVDDEPVNLQVLANNLGLANYEIATATDGLKALELCETFHPDLVVLDVMMPGLDGFEVCRRIREKRPASELPIILLTARTQLKDLLEGFGIGANDYLTKPFSRGELLARVRAHVQMSKIAVAYGHFVPHEFLSILGKDSILDVRLGDQVQRDMTVMFADIRSFTSLAEGLSPADTFAFVNAYLGRVAPVIRNCGGIVDKYIGDAIMALFPDRPENAMRAAVEMQGVVASINEGRLAKGRAPIRIGIGLHSGRLILGTLGEEKRMEQTVISDAVNLASRVEGLTKRYGAPVLVSEPTWSSLPDPRPFHFRFLGKAQVKGKNEATAVYELLEGDTAESRNLKMEGAEEFDRGLRQFYDRQFAEASVSFSRILKANPEDVAARLYLERAAAWITRTPPPEWDGTESFLEK